MTTWGMLQIGLAVATWLALAKPLGLYMARVYAGVWPVAAGRWQLLERWIYRAAGVEPQAEMSWRQYASCALAINAVGFLAVFALQRVQLWLPLNPDERGAVSSDSAFNTALSFVTNTNWQGYAGESTMSHLTQMAGLGVQNFLSAATGMAVLVAMIRGFARANSETLGNFWVDLTRGTLYVLLPLSLVLALTLVSQGVVQTFQAAQRTALVEPTRDSAGNEVATQTIPLGPVASQVAIKQLGTNGGGYFNANSAHPFENPTPWSNFCQVVAILLLPVALPVTMGQMLGERRQGWALLAAMGLVFAPLLGFVVWAEQAGNPRLAALGVDDRPSEWQAGGNLEGKETRFGVANSALWAVATTAASNGSVNAMHDSFTPLGGLAPLWLIQLGEVIFGGVGSGLYGMLIFALLAVFVAGLMVGRTPEYLGKKIGAFEIKMAALAILLPCVVTLIGTAIACVTAAGTSSTLNPGPHGFSELLYAFSSAANNNGSAFAGLNANTPFYNGLLGVAMFVGRYGVMIPALAIGGSLARKKKIPAGSGTLPTDTPLFVSLLVAVVLLVGALSFLPALALGPIVEHIMLWRG